ncbi:NGG1p interacting factor NIF3 [Patescibacteria group bacterium]|nr:NGG1p interacting factor NIF3 [Patescibacteria group bacterium]
MTIQQIYTLAIKKGMEADLRGEKQVKKMLARIKKQYGKMDQQEKQEFDKERLTNPFSDTRILVDTKKPIKRILTGIDMEVGELLLADRLGNIDLVLAHHPEGLALAGLDDVMHLQAEVLNLYGVPINIAESLIKLRIQEVSRSISPINHNQSVDAARLLKIGFMCVHTPTDNLVADFLKRLIARKKPEYIEDLLDLLKTIPEYQQAIKMGSGPHYLTGQPGNHCGRIALTEITGGTEGSPQIYEKMAQAGVGTIVSMHLSEKHYKEAKKAHINVVVAGHISSDSLGLNLFLDELAKKGIEIIPCSGLMRVERFKKK